MPSLASEFIRAEYTPGIYSKQMWKGLLLHNIGFLHTLICFTACTACTGVNFRLNMGLHNMDHHAVFIMQPFVAMSTHIKDIEANTLGFARKSPKVKIY